MSNSRQYCTFHVGDMFLGVPVEHVQEVLRYHAMTRVPLANSAVSGLINLRGQIVTAIDLRQRLDLPRRESSALPMNVVIHDRDNPISFLVDRIGDVLEVDEDLREPAPATVAESVRRLIVGAYKLPDKLLLVLDDEELLNNDDPVSVERRMTV